MEKDCLQRMLEEGCGDAERFYDCAKSLLDVGQFEMAVQACDRAIELDPNFARAFNRMGFAKNRLGRNLEAIADCDRAIELDPNFDDNIEAQKDLDTYVFCKFGEVTRDELFYLRVFQMNFIQYSPVFPGTEESTKSFLENLIKSTLELSRLAAPVLSPLSAGFAQAMTALAGDFLAKNTALSTDDRVGQYQKFKANFQSYIFEQIAEIGEEEFYRRYLIRGFDRF